MFRPKLFVRSVFCSLRFRLLLPVVLACLPLVALTIHKALGERRQVRREWTEQAEKLAHTAEREEKSVVGATRQFLAAVAESSPVQAANPKASQKLLDHLASSYERYSGLGLLTLEGEAVACSGALPEGVERLSCFQQTIETESFHAMVAPGPGGAPRPLHFTYPVLGATGQLQAVVFARMDSDWLERADSELADLLPKGAIWFQMDSKGRILRRYPSNPEFEQRRFPELSQVLYEKQFGSHEVPDRSGPLANMFLAFAPVQSHLAGDMVLGVLGAPRKALFAEADEMLSQNLSWLAIATVLALGIGWFGSKLLVLEPISALAKSSDRLAAGDLTARTGLKPSLDQLGGLTRAFDRMAQNLEAREQERKRTNQKLQVLSRRLVEVQESERRAIARELHDEVGQSLTAAQLGLQTALQAEHPSSTRGRLQASSEMLQRVIEQVHDLSLDLRPSMLDDFGLEAALRWYIARQSETSGIKAEFDAEPLAGRLDALIETTCFRVVQEAINNLVRHSRAKRFRVELKPQEQRLQLLVRDDGVGFDVPARREQAARGSSLGLLSMAERAALADGTLEIESWPGAGTEIRASFPLKLRI